MSIPRNPGKWKKSKICVAADYKKFVIMPEKSKPDTAPIHLTSPQPVALNKNFLLALVNPTDVISTEKRIFLNRNEKVTISVIDPKREEIVGQSAFKDFFKVKNKEHLLNLKHIPTLSEFKILLALLHYAQKKKSAALEFKSMLHLLNHVGLSEGVYNYDQVFMTMLNFIHLVIQYESSYLDNFYPRADSETYILEKRKEILNFLILKRIGMDGDYIVLEFDADFLEECEKAWVQDLHIEKINKIKSPKTMQLYLWLLSWSKRRNSDLGVKFDRQHPIDFSFLFDELGWKKPDEGSCWLQPAKMLQQVTKCMDEIKAIDSGFKDFEALLENKRLCFQKRPITGNVE